MIKAFRFIIAIIIAYITLEYWARKRFDDRNTILPPAIRANMGVDPYEAMKLKENFVGKSKTGVLYMTDELGFRIGKQGKKEASEVLLLGGDSRVFGLALPWEKTLASMMEQKHVELDVEVQALPGGSPAFMLHDMFEMNKWDRLNPKPGLFIYAYDVYDGYGDFSFVAGMKNAPKQFSLRHLKVMLGGYFWNMSSIKFKSFLARSSLFNENKTKKKNAETKTEYQKPVKKSLPIHEESILSLFNKAEEKKMQSYFLYLPRFVELVSRNAGHRDQLKKFCSKNEIAFIDAYGYIDAYAQGDLEKLKTIFLDVNEGIHFSEGGFRKIHELIELKVLK